MSETQRPSPAQPGRLTSVMRSATQQGAPKVLRVGLVHKGKVIDERLVDPGEHVTVGPNERATFVLRSSALPPSFRLFERTREGYSLQVLPHMGGRVAQKDGVADLAALRSDARVVKVASGFGAAHVIPLAEDARGKVTLGEVTVLFQFVAPAPSLGKPQLPASVKSGIEVDVRTSVIAAFSFLLHFGAVGSIYSDWMDPVVDDEAETTQILESVKQLPAPPPIEHPKDDVPTPSPATSATAVARTQAPSGPAQGGRGGASGNGGSAGTDARAHQLSSQLASLELQVLSAINGGGPATSSVLGSGGDLPLGMLEKAAASANGARDGGLAGLDFGGRSGGPLRPGAIGRSPIPGDAGPMVPMGPGSAAPVRPPPGGSVAVPGPTQTGGNVPNAAAVVAAMAPGFRRCYNAGLNREDPTMKGTVRITARIGPNGEVLSASASPGGTVSASVAGCMRNRVASAQFAAPEGGGSTLIIPVTVIPQ